MKRSLKALLVSGAVAASLFGTAAPASADICIGVHLKQGVENVGVWTCTCPSLTYGPLDGEFWVIACVRDEIG